ncbi:MAG: tetratricopeptide repeat protein [Chloroflexi bacterium]|nr:tetratricopeptide repeat protein [Chloroflexota bacterium]
MKRLSLLFAVIILLVMPGAAWGAQEDIKINLLGPSNPSISRFLGFKAVIPAGVASRIRPGSLRLLVNGEDMTFGLQQVIDPGTRDLMLSFTPGVPLPMGKVVESLTGQMIDGKNFSKQWYFIIDPSADPDLAFSARKVKKNPENIAAIYSMGKAYEKKFMLEDAALCYKQVVDIDPNQKKARASYYNIFKRLDRKVLEVEGLNVEVARYPFQSANLPLILVQVNAYNGDEKRMVIDAKGAKMSAGGETSSAASSISQFAGKAYSQRLISAEQYAKLSYELEKKSPSLMVNSMLMPGMYVRGMMAFPLMIPGVKEFTIILPVNIENTRTEYLKFPFQVK